MARTSFLKKRRGVNNHIQEGSRMVDALILAVIVLICVLTLYPMYYVFIMSISKPQDVMAMNVYLWPTGFELEAYKKIFTDSNMWRAYANSILYTASSTILILITSVLGAYPLSVPELRGRKFVVAFVLLPMYFGGGLIPTFLVMNCPGSSLSTAMPVKSAKKNASSIWNRLQILSYHSFILGLIPNKFL